MLGKGSITITEEFLAKKIGLKDEYSIAGINYNAFSSTIRFVLASATLPIKPEGARPQELRIEEVFDTENDKAFEIVDSSVSFPDAIFQMRKGYYITQNHSTNIYGLNAEKEGFTILVFDHKGNGLTQMDNIVFTAKQTISDDWVVLKRKPNKADITMSIGELTHANN